MMLTGTEASLCVRRAVVIAPASDQNYSSRDSGQMSPAHGNHPVLKCIEQAVYPPDRQCVAADEETLSLPLLFYTRSESLPDPLDKYLYTVSTGCILEADLVNDRIEGDKVLSLLFVFPWEKAMSNFREVDYVTCLCGETRAVDRHGRAAQTCGKRCQLFEKIRQIQAYCPPTVLVVASTPLRRAA